MGKFLTRERFGRPQVLAGFLLLGFLAQCGWLLVRGTDPLEMDSSHLFRIVEGLQQWSEHSVAGTPSVERMEAGTPTPPEVDHNDGYDPNHSPLWYLVASLPMLGWTGTSDPAGFGELARKWREAGGDWIGGCCRTGPADIRSVKQCVHPE